MHHSQLKKYVQLPKYIETRPVINDTLKWDEVDSSDGEYDFVGFPSNSACILDSTSDSGDNNDGLVTIGSDIEQSSSESECDKIQDNSNTSDSGGTTLEDSEETVSVVSSSRSMSSSENGEVSSLENPGSSSAEDGPALMVRSNNGHESIQFSQTVDLEKRNKLISSTPCSAHGTGLGSWNLSSINDIEIGMNLSARDRLLYEAEQKENEVSLMSVLEVLSQHGEAVDSLEQNIVGVISELCESLLELTGGEGASQGVTNEKSSEFSGFLSTTAVTNKARIEVLKRNINMKPIKNLISEAREVLEEHRKRSRSRILAHHRRFHERRDSRSGVDSSKEGFVKSPIRTRSRGRAS